MEAVRHDETRTTIPSAEMAHLAPDDSGDAIRYPRDRALDPQLVWQGKEAMPQLAWLGKDAEDGVPLEVPPVPIYVQEKIVPQALIENLRKTAKAGEREPEATLFDDFDGLEEADLTEFYEHDKGKWANRMILGDSLLVMTSLAEKEDLRGKVQMIYVDPPYGIKVGSNWQVSTRKRDVKDGKASDATREPEQVKAFRDTWELGVNSYLSYLRDRLLVARELLTETGSIFVQIGDENVHLVRSLMDEVYGAENFVSLITFKKTSGAGSFSGGTNVLAAVNDYIVWYSKDLSQAKYRQLHHRKTLDGAGGAQYGWIETPIGDRRRATKEELRDSKNQVFRADQLTSQTTREAQTTVFPVEVSGRSFLPSTGGWKTNKAGMGRLAQARRLIPVGNTLSYVRYLEDFPAFPINNFWDDTVTSGFADPKTYVVQTNTKVVERCMLMTTDPGDLVLDPTCGSGTTAFVAEQWGRRWITTDTSRVALALARTRLMAGKYPAYLLADSAEGAKKEADVTGVPDMRGDFGGDVRQGFVVKRVPHITLKSIAQNPDITEGMTREQIDAAIARHAETELLVDQPYVDTRKVRVSGKFTVESLSPHRLVEPDPTDVHTPDAPLPGPVEIDEVASFETMILDNLRTAGVQNTYKDERLAFERLEAVPGEWIQAEGTSAAPDGGERRVAVSIGPEYGTVGQRQLTDAANEAAKAVPGYDLVLVVGFAFEPGAWQRASELNANLAERKVGNMRVLLAKANPDLAMGDDLLKKTGAGNLFMVFGEPDIAIETIHVGPDHPSGVPEGDALTVEVRGLDVYDPTRGEVRSASTDDIAAWFIDTDYDGRQFFVRHAYFTGGHQPYESLAKALRADIDPDAWATLYATTSRPFAKPATGKIAVKVINHYGDEILQTYDVS